MAVSQLNGGGEVYNGLIARRCRQANPSKELTRSLLLENSSRICNFYALLKGNKMRNGDAVCCSLSTDHNKMLSSSLVMRQRKPPFSVVKNKLSTDFSVQTSDMEDSSATEEDYALSNSEENVGELAGISYSETSEKIKDELTVYPSDTSHPQDIKHELIMLSLPALAGQAIEPFSQLMETAYIGRLGSVELASAGVSISIFNIISKLFNIPLLSIATSFVAEEISKTASHIRPSEESYGVVTNGKPFDVVATREQLSSVSTALLLAVGIGLIEAIALAVGSGVFLNLMGIPSASTMHAPAQRFLSLRALGAPAVVVSLALQGVFRGFKDTKTPVFCLGVGNFSAILLLPILMYYCKLGVTGAAISTVISQYTVTCLMLWYLSKRVVLLPPKLGSLQFSGYLKSGGFLLGRTLAVLTTTTLGTSMAARQGPVAMAAHQICLQVWLAVSLMTDALAASGQALIAGAASKGDYKAVKEITYFVLKIGLATGILLAAGLGVSFSYIATLFTKDAEVLSIVRTGVLFVCASQPVNALAFIFDGLHYGVSDFKYAACSMMLVGAVSSAFLFYVPSFFGLPGVWAGLTLFMGLRMVAGIIRLSTKTGPWWFLHGDYKRIEVTELAN